ncbi:MAG TPA: acetate--CoA ligase family protein [Casimicrobiaceae bacterium]|nr:acetate--CoA ligase family protein [Casimicrobiaceae bacterium]
MTFGRLTPLLAPRAVAVVGASDREGSLGGIAAGYLARFGFAGPVWPVNPGRATVAGLQCYPSLRELPGVPDLAVIAVAADDVLGVVRDCVSAGVPAGVAWAGGFAEVGGEGVARQRELAAFCRDSGFLLCGPNCVGLLNTGNGLTASFTTMLRDRTRMIPGVVSMVSQSGGISVMAHARAEEFGLGFRVTASCGNEVALGLSDFMRALVDDDGTHVIAVYAEGLSDPDAFVDALALAKTREKPVVVLKGGTAEAGSRAALAHTGRLAGSDRTFDAICRELAVIRVHSSEELLDVCLQLGSMRRDQLPAGPRVLVSSFGGGSGVVCTDQCERAGLQVPLLAEATRNELRDLVTPLSSVANPIDFTPGMMTVPRHRADVPAALDTLAAAPDVDAWLFLAAGFDRLAPELVGMYDAARQRAQKAMFLTWQAMPKGTPAALASRGIYAFSEHARAVRALRHLVAYSDALRHAIRRVAPPAEAFPWHDFVASAPGSQVLPEDRVAAILGAAGLAVARGQSAAKAGEAAAIARAVGFPVAMKALSPVITHRAAVGLVALGIATEQEAAKVERRFHARAAELGVALDGVWVQHMFEGDRELLVTAFRDREFGVVVGCGVGGAATELVDDVAFARAPIDVTGAFDLVGGLRTLRRMPGWLSTRQRELAADYLARFSALACTAPWPRFTLEVNPLKLAAAAAAAVDGLLVIE